MRRRISSKSETCTGGMDVYAVGISVKVGCALPGEVSMRVSHNGEYQGLQERRRCWKGMEKSAEGIVGLSTGLKA